MTSFQIHSGPIFSLLKVAKKYLIKTPFINPNWQCATLAMGHAHVTYAMKWVYKQRCKVQDSIRVDFYLFAQPDRRRREEDSDVSIRVSS
jgi:hypothetical protein